LFADHIQNPMCVSVNPAAQVIDLPGLKLSLNCIINEMVLDSVLVEIAALGAT
jgi:hypothetical protein